LATPKRSILQHQHHQIQQQCSMLLAKKQRKKERGQFSFSLPPPTVHLKGEFSPPIKRGQRFSSSSEGRGGLYTLSHSPQTHTLSLVCASNHLVIRGKRRSFKIRWPSTRLLQNYLSPPFPHHTHTPGVDFTNVFARVFWT